MTSFPSALRFDSVSVRGVVHPYLDHHGPLAIAHRGGAGVYPENTERAFRHAVELGFTHLETDVHVTQDNKLVVFHDKELDRVTDQVGLISDLSWAAVKRARVDGTDSVMRLEELFEAFPETRINIDPKDDQAIQPLAAALSPRPILDRVCVTAFSGRRTRAVKEIVGPGLCTGAGPLGVLGTVLAGYMVPIRSPRFETLQVPVAAGSIPIVTRRFVAGAHRHDLAVHVWTIDDPEEIDRLLDLGVDGIMTDQPETLREVYMRRGLWPC